MKRILASLLTVLGAVAILLTVGGASSGVSGATYKIQVDNGFGIVSGADFKVAGVRAGSIKSIDLDPNTLHAVITVNVTTKGFDSFRSDVMCDTRPQSLIGEYFIECDPGRNGRVLPPGSTIPVDRTRTTIPSDLLNDIMRLPYRQRFSIILGELGAAVAGRSDDLQQALRRAVPALDETDNLLRVLADDSTTLQQLTQASDTVVTALANNSRDVQRFISEAGRAASLSAARNTDLQATFHKLPPLLEQLRPTLAQLGAATDANTPALQNLQAAAPQITRLFRDLVPFDNSSRISLQSLGQAAITGNGALAAARPTISHLNTFAKPVPELGGNLGIVLPHLDNRKFATEKDPRSPGGAGYTGLEALLQYVFNQAVSINTFGPYGHVLTVDGIGNSPCLPYASPKSIAAALKQYGAAYRNCYAFLGPNQPGVNETDPSNPSAPVPDPGGAPPWGYGPKTSAAKLVLADTTRRAHRGAPARHAAAAQPARPNRGVRPRPTPVRVDPIAGGKAALGTVGNTIASVIGTVLNGSGAAGGLGALAGGSGSGAGAGAPRGSGSANTSKLLNYLLAP